MVALDKPTQRLHFHCKNHNITLKLALVKHDRFYICLYYIKGVGTRYRDCRMNGFGYNSNFSGLQSSVEFVECQGGPGAEPIRQSSQPRMSGPNYIEI